MDVMIHLGAHRCGTTTFQQFLARNRDRIEARGVETWSPERVRNGFFHGLIHRPADVTPSVERRGNRSLGLISIELERLERAGRNTLLISEENMIGSIVNNLRQGELYPDSRARLQRFARGLRPHCRRIGIAIRAYDTYWSSSLAFGVAQGRPMPTPQVLDQLTDQPRRWRHLIEDVAQVFPEAEILVWPFERFVSQPEVPLALLVPPLETGIEFVGLRDWTNASPRRDRLRRLLALRGDQQARLALPDGDGRWMPFNTPQQAELRRDYAEDLAWLRGGAGGAARLIESPAQGIVPAAEAASDETLLRCDAETGWSERGSFEITRPEATATPRRTSEETRDHERGNFVV